MKWYIMYSHNSVNYPKGVLGAGEGGEPENKHTEMLTMVADRWRRRDFQFSVLYSAEISSKKTFAFVVGGNKHLRNHNLLGYGANIYVEVYCRFGSELARRTKLSDLAPGFIHH